jgi:hypothetical protein
MNINTILHNLLLSIPKAGAAVGVGTAAFDMTPVIFPHCSTWLCTFVGGFVGLTLWGALAQKAQAPGTPNVAP